MLILAIMSGLGYATYRAARISAERTEESLRRSREIEFGMRMIVQDLAQAVPRPVRDLLGQARLPALRGTAGRRQRHGADFHPGLELQRRFELELRRQVRVPA